VKNSILAEAYGVVRRCQARGLIRFAASTTPAEGQKAKVRPRADAIHLCQLKAHFDDAVRAVMAAYKLDRDTIFAWTREGDSTNARRAVWTLLYPEHSSLDIALISGRNSRDTVMHGLRAFRRTLSVNAEAGRKFDAAQARYVATLRRDNRRGTSEVAA
jgi:hypothetical protein